MWYVIWFFVGCFLVAFALIALAMIGSTIGRTREPEPDEQITQNEIE